MKGVYSAAFALLWACQGGVQSPAPQTPRLANSAPVAVHTFASGPAGISANAYMVEGPTAIIVVDSALTVTEAKNLRERVRALHKPVAAVLLTHGHPDHYNGVATLLEETPDVPIFATEAVAEVITSHDTEKAQQWSEQFGEEWPKRRSFPNRLLASGQTIEIDGLHFTVHELGPGESHADSFWLLDGAVPAAFIGDVVLHGEHAYLSDGHSSKWLENIARLERELVAVPRLYPGHGAAGGLELLSWQRTYLETYRTEIERLRAGGATLTPAQKDELVTAMKKAYPKAGLEFLIPLGADPIAGELSQLKP